MITSATRTLTHDQSSDVDRLLFLRIIHLHVKCNLLCLTIYVYAQQRLDLRKVTNKTYGLHVVILKCAMNVLPEAQHKTGDCCVMIVKAFSTIWQK